MRKKERRKRKKKKPQDENIMAFPWGGHNEDRWSVLQYVDIDSGRPL